MLKKSGYEHDDYISKLAFYTDNNDHECSTIDEISIWLPLFNLLSGLSKHLRRGQKECKSQSVEKIIMEYCPLDVAHMNS